MAEARGNVTIGPEQIGRTRLGVVTLCNEARGVGQSALTADADILHAIGHIDRCAIAERQQRKVRSTLAERIRQVSSLANGGIEHGTARRWSTTPGIRIARRQ